MKALNNNCTTLLKRPLQEPNEIINPSFEKKHFKDVDIAKGLAIICVVFGHTYRGLKLDAYIYTFHIPLFFFISGLLFSPDKYTSFKLFFQRKSITLLLPYVTFYIISYFYWLLIERKLRPEHPPVELYKPIIGLFYGTDYDDYMWPNGALWFLTCLFVTEIIFYSLLQKIKAPKHLLTTLLFVAAIGIIINNYIFFKLPFGIESSFMALVFLGLGYLSKSLSRKLCLINFKYLLFTSIFCLLLVYFLSTINGEIDMDYGTYGSPYLFIVGAIIGIIGCLALSKIIIHNKPLEFLGINSLIIFGLSEPVKRACIGVVSKVTAININDIRHSVILSFICVVLTILLLLPIIYIFNNYLYMLIGKKSHHAKL